MAKEEAVMAGLKHQRWHDLPRQTRLALVMYPDLAPKDRQQEMAAYAMAERKKSPMQGKVDSDRAYANQASPGRRK